jgi:hypothetical protein
MLKMVVLALGLAVLSATPAVAQAATQDSVTGGGVSPEAFCNGPIEIDAHSGPGGEDPSGHVVCGTLFDGPVTCLNVQASVALLTVDAPTAPTSKEQCNNGGWRTYGVFKNQGDCVSFVATKGKNPPSRP